jgi:hypothetical protein
VGRVAGWRMFFRQSPAEVADRVRFIGEGGGYVATTL